MHWQNVPHKCRRRAASHHKNRIPERVRQKIKEEIVPIGKRPSKKYKKRRNLTERLKVLKKKCMATHRWHAKRYQMTILDEQWAVPITPNDKHFRANYRSIHTNCYLEDLSYYTCFEIESRTELLKSQCFGQVLVRGVFHDTIETLLETEEYFEAIIYNQDSSVLGQIIVWISDKIRIWCHPKLQKSLEILFKNVKYVIKDDFCRFRLLGPNAKSKILPENLNFDKICKVSLRQVPVSKIQSDEEIMIAEVLGNRSSGFGSGFDIYVPKTAAVKLWIDLTHSKLHVGCLDSHEQLDIEVERMDSERLSLDFG